MNYWLGVFVVDTFLVGAYMLLAARKIVFVSGGDATGEAAAILDEHRRDLRGAVRAYRWIGVMMTVAVAITAGAALLQLISSGMSAVFAGLSIYTGLLTLLIRIVFRRVDMYEQMYRDSLPRVRTP